MTTPRVMRWLAGAVLVVLLALISAYAAVRTALAPAEGEWSTTLRLGPLPVKAGVPSLIRLATARWMTPLLDGRSVATRAGRLTFTRQPDGRTLMVVCAPCAFKVPGMGGAPLVLRDVSGSVLREGDALSGELVVDNVAARWRGRLRTAGIDLTLQVPPTAISDAYALLGDAIPETLQAHIRGNFTLTATLSLPERRFTAVPLLTDFSVSGLGTEALLNTRSSCSSATSKLAASDWLARAVIAAEDQRFFTHTGYDMTELAAALSVNQQGDSETIQRGGSTLTQQLARLLVTGGDRSATRKLRELLYAVEMEQTLGKARILQMYLANAPWGPGVCGAEAASRRYFHRAAHTLTPAQAAWMAAMLHNPGMEVERWASTGQINVARAQWVLEGLRPLPPRKQRAAQIEALKAMPYPRKEALKDELKSDVPR